MSVEITAAQAAAIRRHGETGYPNEICGVLLGREAAGHKTVQELLPITNQFAADEQYHRFLITPEDMLRAEKTARAQGLSVVGFYHSHPEAEAVASSYDRDHAWPWYTYIIVSVKERVAQELRSWTLRDDRSAFDEEPIRFNE
ncbi:MAG TPA: M67 family metallopeptidase [Chloroflexia bacterium]|nr:M67 family metallopeptidase [Chloroflexia bacterium]